jgi:segregation and condensation protein A
MQQQIFDLLLDSDEVTWQTIIYKLVREEGMDPWDIDISLLSKKYIVMLKKLKEMDFRISGKVLLAAAIMLKLKSTRLIGEDMNQFDMLIASAEKVDEESAEDFYNQLESELSGAYAGAGMVAGFPSLMPKTPQPRVRKVSIYDLIESLEKALEVNRKRVLRTIPVRKMTRPVKEKDVTGMITAVYNKVLGLFSKDKPLFFTHLLSSDTKEEKLSTFVPLLHLAKDRKIDMDQKQHFGPIQIMLVPEQPKMDVFGS